MIEWIKKKKRGSTTGMRVQIKSNNQGGVASRVLSLEEGATNVM